MICKWCGATVDVTKGKCSVCGKELPPLSDCGGFYNVAPKAAKVNPAPNAEQPASQPVPGPMGQNRTEGPAPNEKSKKRMTILLAAALVLLAAAVVFSIVQSISLSKRIAALEEANSGREIPVVTEKNTMEPSETPSEDPAEATEAPSEAVATPADVPTEAPTVTTEASELTEMTEENLAEQEITFTIDRDGKMTVELNGKKVSDFVKNGENILLNGMETLYVSLEEDEDGATETGRTFVFTYDIINPVFGTSGPVNYAWQYRTTEKGAWLNASDYPSDFLKKEHTDYETPQCNLTVSKELIKNNGYFELRCTLTRESKEGGTLTIVYEFVTEKLPPATQNG